MALSKTVLRGLIQTKLAALSPPVTLAARDLAVYEAIADAIVTHITTSAVIPSGIAVATTGSAAAQTGATTAAGVVT